jgi:hypothetical protein
VRDRHQQVIAELDGEARSEHSHDGAVERDLDSDDAEIVRTLSGGSEGGWKDP